MEHKRVSDIHIGGTLLVMDYSWAVHKELVLSMKYSKQDNIVTIITENYKIDLTKTRLDSYIPYPIRLGYVNAIFINNRGG